VKFRQSVGMVKPERSEPRAWFGGGSGTVRLIIGLTVLGVAVYAKGTDETSWPLIGLGLVSFVAGIVVAVIAVRRHLAQRP
jgi:hypothetical protein